MTTVLLVALMVLADSTGDVFLTTGMKQVGEVSSIRLRALWVTGRKVIVNKNYMAGVFFMAVSFFSFLALLSWADLSFVFPAKALVYVTSTLGAKWILKEAVSAERWAGIILICLGVALISLP
jgi:drug/metabolite transporter (DMT)-like permease